MNLFKDSEVKLHKIEKIGILLGAILISLFFISLYWASFEIAKGFIQRLGSLGILVIGIAYPVLVFMAITGRGLSSKKSK